MLACVAIAGGCRSIGGSSAPEPRDWNAPVDFTALRGEYGHREDFDSICSGSSFDEFAAQARAKDWDGIVAGSGPWLESCPVDLDVQFLRAVALKETGLSEESDLHLVWYKGLAESVLASGNGRTPQTAWVVISVREEYAVLRGLRVKPVSHELLAGNIDAVEVERRDGKRVTIYFDPKAHFQRLARRQEKVSETSE
jgi:hypothetical protein